MTYATEALRGHDYTADTLGRERRLVTRHASPDASADWRSMVMAIIHGEAPVFTTRRGRSALRYGGILHDRLYQSPLRHYATCARCGVQASECLCATDSNGYLYVYRCDVCGEPVRQCRRV